MKTKILSITAALFLYANGYSQVGINTMNPTSTLDVTAKNATGTTTNVDGFLVPRVDRERAQSMTGVPTSTIIYVNNIATGTQVGTAANIDAVGHYYYDGTIWTKMNSSSGTSTNIYNSDGTLTGNRIVAQGANTLAFTGTAANAFSVDGSTFSVDAANKRIGIGTTAPANKLHLGNDVGSSATDVVGKKLAVYNNSSGTDFYGLGVNSATLQFHAASTATAAPGMVLKSNGNVGVGTTTPAEKMDVSGAITFTGKAVANKTSASTIDNTSSNARLLSWGPDATTNGAISFWTGIAGGAAAEKMRIHTNGNVGIGTSTPNNNLDLGATVGSNVTDATGKKFAVYNNAAGTEFYGLGVSPSTLQFHAASTNAAAPGMVLTDAGKVGIGISTPANKLHLGTDMGSSVTDVAGKKLAVYNDAGGTDFYGLGVSAATLQFHAASTAAEAPGMVLTGGGNVGIGTTAPSNKLHVSATADPLRLQGVQSGSGANLVIDANGVVKQESKTTPKLTVVVKRGTDFVGPGGITLIPWDSKVYDPENAFALNSTTYTITKSGLHQVFLNVTASNDASHPFNTGDAWFIRIWKNNTVIAASDATKASGSSTTVFAVDDFVVGDQISVDFGSKPNIAVANLTRLSIFRFE